MKYESTLTPRQLHNQHMDSWGGCPDGPDCPFCIADRQAAEREHGDYSSDSQWSDEDKQNWVTDYRERARDINSKLSRSRR